MTVPLRWADLADARVGLLGLGVEGRAALRRCRALGITPALVDDSPVRDAGGRPVPVDGLPVLATQEGGGELLARCDVVVKTPGISRYRPDVEGLRAAGVRVTGGLALWLAGADADRVLCVTGTKGKSTTAAITGHLLTGLGRRVLVGGNIGVPPYDPAAPGTDDAEFWVIEVSSYQAADLEVAPRLVAVTSLHPDHLPWHRDDVDTYYRDKLSLCTRPLPAAAAAGQRLVVANGDSELLRARAGAGELGPRVEWVHDADRPQADWAGGFGAGRHNRRNALIARSLVAALGVPGADDDGRLAGVAAGYTPLAHRLTEVAEVGGVTFVDDSLSTTVLPTLAAVDAYPGRAIALLVGGYDRGVDYTPLAEGLRGRVWPTLLLAMPDSGPRIAAQLRAVGLDRAGIGVVEVADLDEAVRRGYDWARTAAAGPDGGGVVLLSPAAASFGRFADYAARAEAFTAAARSLAVDGAGV